MYVKKNPRPLFDTLPARLCVALGIAGLFFGLHGTVSAQPQVIRNITEPTQRLELTVNTSRILTLEKRIPKMVVNNPELVSVTPISANQVQIAAKKPGVTQINLWDEDDQVYTIDMMIYGDVRELDMALQRLFPQSSVKVIRLTNSLVLEGFVERPEVVSPIVRLAEDYAPKVVNNITVGGVQQILLKVKVMEVSRTKLRKLGVDWALQTDSGNIFASGISGLLRSVGDFGEVPTTQGATFQAFISGNDATFLAAIEALQQNNVAKVLADPTITAVSGRPAHFNVGGELPILIPSGLGQTTVEYKSFGTQVDFVPIVLGNGNIRLEVRPRVSEIDDTRAVNIDNFVIPALKVREVDTGVEMKAGQTLALAGLVQTRIDAQERGLPFFGDLPLVGTAFRSVEEEVNEIELLILVTPEFAGGMDPHEVPQCGPGMESVSPSNCQLYWGGHLEVPACGPCGPGNCVGCGGSNTGCSMCNGSGPSGAAFISDGSTVPAPIEVGPAMGSGIEEVSPVPVDLPTPAPSPIHQGEPSLEAPAVDPTALQQTNPWAMAPTGNPLPRGFRSDSTQTPANAGQPRTATSTPGLMGPIGYDVE